MTTNEDGQGALRDEGDEGVREVDSLFEAFQADFKQHLTDLPRVAELVEARRAGDRLEIALTPDEIAKLQATMLWDMRGWIGNLARAVDRLYEAVEDLQAQVGHDDSDEQGDASRR